MRMLLICRQVSYLTIGINVEASTEPPDKFLSAVVKSFVSHLTQGFFICLSLYCLFSWRLGTIISAQSWDIVACHRAIRPWTCCLWPLTRYYDLVCAAMNFNLYRGFLYYVTWCLWTWMCCYTWPRTCCNEFVYVLSWDMTLNLFCYDLGCSAIILYELLWPWMCCYDLGHAVMTLNVQLWFGQFFHFYDQILSILFVI